MKRVWGHILAGASLVASAAAFSTACTHDDSTIFVFDVLAPQLVSAGSECLFTTDPTQPYISAGTLDIGFRSSYFAEFLVGNQMISQANPVTPTPETSYVQIQGAVVRITDTTGHQLANYTTKESSTIAPSQGTTPSYEAIGAEIVNPATVADFSSELMNGGLGGPEVTLITYTYFFGQTLGGESVQTGEFSFPVTLCYGCEVSYSQSDVNENASIVPNCLNAQNSTASALPEPCIPGQDAPIDCSQCLGYEVCRGSIAGITAPPADAGAD